MKKFDTKRSSWRLFAIFAFLMLLVPLVGFSQKTIKGVVTDDVGEPLIGASILVQNSSIGTVSDLDGNFSISLPESTTTAILEISYLGYSISKNPVDFGDSHLVTLDVQLESDFNQLDEVVVTGASVATTRKQLGNAISTVSADDLQNTGTNNVLGSLSGKIMGAQISQNNGDAAGGISIRLRGASTINGSSDPLYIVDGVIVDNSSQNVINMNADAMETGFQAGQNRLVDLNTNDIERIEVINGAAAAAIYGSMASNGVVQIFTKKGKVGAPKISFSTSLSVSKIRKRLEFTKYGKRFGIKGSDDLGTTQDRLTIIADLRSEADRAANPGKGPAALAGRPLVTDVYDVERYDYQDNIFQTAIGNDNYLSISGGTVGTRYYGSISYGKNEGILANTHFQKYGAKLRVDQSLAKWAKMSVGLNYINSSSKDMPNGNNFFSPVSAMIITDNVWDITAKDEEGNLPHAEPVRLNPLTIIETYDIRQQTNRFMGDMQFSVFPMEGMTIKYVLGMDAYSLVGNTFQPRVPYSPVSAAFFDDGYVAVANSNVSKINNDITASYQKDFSEILKSTTTLGWSRWNNKTSFSSAAGRDLGPFVQTLGAANNLFTTPTEVITESWINGYFLQQSFGYNDILFVTVAGRVDGSSRFGIDQRNQFYPKASASFVLSELGGWKNAGLSSAWNNFKLRFSYGKAGNLTGIGPYTRFTNFSAQTLGGKGAIVPNSQLGNSDIKPEQQTELEFGTDMSFLKNRLGLSVTYYSQKITDLLLNRNLAPSSGGGSIIENIGEMSNKGIELMLTGRPMRSKSFTWDMTVAFNSFKNVVNGIGGGRAGITLRGGGGAQSAIDGQPLGVFFARQYARNADGSLLLKPVEVDGGVVMLPQVARGNDVTGVLEYDDDGQPMGTPVRTVLGDPNPDWTGSLINEFKYKKLGLRLQFDAVQGFDVWNWNSITSNNVGSSLLSEKELKGELPRGWVAAIGGFVGPRIQEAHVEDGSFVKLREFALTYDTGRLNKSFSNMTVSIIGRNLISWDNYSGYDPETNSAGQSSTVRGDDFGNIPIPKTWMLGLNVSF